VADEPDYTSQPAPTVVDDAVSSHDMVIKDLEAWGEPELTDEAIKAVAARKAYGLEKYRVVLHKDNGRDHNLDAEEEALDLCAYLRTWIDEQPGMIALIEPMYRDAMWLLVCIRNWRTKRKGPVMWFDRRHGPLTPHPSWPALGWPALEEDPLAPSWPALEDDDVD
jgi:hypothetical protein